MYIKKEQGTEAVKFSTLLDLWHDHHNEWVQVWDDAIHTSVQQRQWERADELVEMRCSIDDLMDKYPEMWEDEFVLSVYDKLSYQWKQEFATVLERLISYHDYCSSGGDYKRLVEVYKDFVFLIEAGYIEQEKRESLFRWLCSRLTVWSLKNKWGGKEENART